MQGLQSARESFQKTEAEFALYKTFQGKKQAKQSPERSVEPGQGELLSLCEKMRFDSREEIEQAFGSMDKYVAEHAVEDGELAFLFSSIIYRMYQKMSVSDPEDKNIFYHAPSKIIAQVMTAPYEKRIVRLKEKILEIREEIDRSQNNSTGKISRKAKKYIEEHYADENLNLCEVAHHVNLSVSYFSVIFKREEGESFSEYLTRLRLEKAQELLLFSDYRSYEIAIMVGYANATYFSTMFKRKYGVSPTDFRKLKQTGELEK